MPDKPILPRLFFPIADIFRSFRWSISALSRQAPAVRNGYTVELLIITCRAMFVTWPYLDFKITTQPAGLEYPAAVQPFYFWMGRTSWHRALHCRAGALSLDLVVRTTCLASRPCPSS